ncbi:SMI1/KNR4 family protein [Pseudomonas piscis]
MSDFPHDIDLDAFWDHDLSAKIRQPAPSDELIAQVQQLLGYRLPASYVAFMRRYNGGYPNLTCFPMGDDHCDIDSFISVGITPGRSLGGQLGSRFSIEEWGYPDLGVYICDCPSAGHDMIALDYRACGPEGEPRVVHVDQEGDYEVTVLAPDFETFVRGLVSWEVYDTSEQDYLDDLDKVANAEFSPLLAELLEHFALVPDLGPRMRHIALGIVEEKRYFALHADPLSQLLYDLQFWLYQNHHPVTSEEQYLQVYSEMIAFAKGFGTGGYAPGFISDWWRARVAGGQLCQVDGGFAFSAGHCQQLLEQLASFPPEPLAIQELP